MNDYFLNKLAKLSAEVRKFGELSSLRPVAIIKKLGLRRPIYKALAFYGHMEWEDLDMA